MENINKLKSRGDHRMLRSAYQYLMALLLTLGSLTPIRAQMQAGIQAGSAGVIRIAEPFVIADTVIVWGDIGASGTYLVPKGTTLLEMISYARWVSNANAFSNNVANSALSQFDFVDRRVEIIVTSANQLQQPRFYQLNYGKPLDPVFRTTEVRNYDVIHFQNKRRRLFRDYLELFSPPITIGLQVLLLIRSYR